MALVLQCGSVLFTVITAWSRTAYIHSVVRMNTGPWKVTESQWPWGSVSEVVGALDGLLSLEIKCVSASLGTAEPAPLTVVRS